MQYFDGHRDFCVRDAFMRPRQQHGGRGKVSVPHFSGSVPAHDGKRRHGDFGSHGVCFRSGGPHRRGASVQGSYPSLYEKVTPSFHIANFLQALIFGLVHFNIIQGLYAFVIGLFLGCVREKYDSLLPAMLLHFAVNASSLFLLGGLLNRIPDTPVSWAVCFVLSLAAAVWDIHKFLR